MSSPVMLYLCLPYRLLRSPNGPGNPTDDPLDSPNPPLDGRTIRSRPERTRAISLLPPVLFLFCPCQAPLRKKKGRPMFGSFGAAVGATSVAFVSQGSASQGVVQRYGLTKRIEPVRGCRSTGKKDMKLNDATRRSR